MLNKCRFTYHPLLQNPSLYCVAYNKPQQLGKLSAEETASFHSEAHSTPALVAR